MIVLPFITKHYIRGSGPAVGITGQELGHIHFEVLQQNVFKHSYLSSQWQEYFHSWNIFPTTEAPPMNYEQSANEHLGRGGDLKTVLLIAEMVLSDNFALIVLL